MELEKAELFLKEIDNGILIDNRLKTVDYEHTGRVISVYQNEAHYLDGDGVARFIEPKKSKHNSWKWTLMIVYKTPYLILK